MGMKKGIRRPKGGGLEIRFYDRIQALECLERMEGARRPALLAALESSVSRPARREEPDGSAQSVQSAREGDGDAL